MADNLDIWNKLGRTDPDHTKTFKRAGGFGGTAIKPIYTTLKMTEQFGPAGKGWGMGDPVFTVVPGSEGQVAVYCTVSLWWAEVTSTGGGISYDRHFTVYGVGGDMVVVKQSSGLRTDDEAFKKAFTDALGNAMKHLGMSADVHMGLFDDSKYVSEVRDEIAAAKQPTVVELKAAYKKLKAEMASEQTHGWRNLGKWLRDEAVLADIEALGRYAEDFKTEARETFDLAKASEEALGESVAVKYSPEVPPSFDHLDAMIEDRERE